MRLSGLANGSEPRFSGPLYLAANRDVAASGIDPLLHYVLDGWAQGRPLRPGPHETPRLRPIAVLGWRDLAWRVLRVVLPRRRDLHPEPGPDPGPTIAIRPARGVMPSGWCVVSAHGKAVTLLVTSGGKAGSVDVPAHPATILVRLPEVPARLTLRRSGHPSPRPVITVLEIAAWRARWRGGGRGGGRLPEDATSYHAWVRLYDTPTPAQREAMAARAAALRPRPSFRIETEGDAESLRAQIYKEWTTEGPTDFVVRVAPGAELAPHALLLFAEAIVADPSVDLLYSDEDRLVDGVRCDPWFKPDHSLERAAEQDLEDSVLVVRNGAGQPARIAHIPQVLAHTPAFSRIRRWASRPTEPRWPTVTAIIPTRDQASLLTACLDGLSDNTDYPALDIIVADNDSTEAETLALLQGARARGVTVLPCPGSFNFSAINNRAAAAARGELLLFLNNDIAIPNPGWLRAMVRLIAEDVGAVGAKLLYPDDTLQHGGVVVGMGGVAGHVHLGASGDDPGYFGRLCVTQEVSAVTAACMLVPARHFAAVGGFDAENLAVAFNDVDLCLRLRKAGLRILWTPHAVLHHWESKSRASDFSPARLATFTAEIAHMQSRWRGELESDPFFSPNLSLETTDIAWAFPPRVPRPWADYGAGGSAQGS